MSYEEILNAQASFFDFVPLYAYLSFSLIVLAPVSCFFMSIALTKQYHGGFLIIPVCHAAFVLIPYGVILAIYLSGWYFARARARAA